MLLNTLSVIFLALFGTTVIGRWILTCMNIGHLQKYGHEVPPVFEGEIDRETLSKMTDYTVASSRFSSFEHFVDDAFLILILFMGFFPWLTDKVEALSWPYIGAGLAFFMILFSASSFFDIPFSLYSTFGIEKKYGFSTITPTLWAQDFLKNFLVSSILILFLLIPFFSLIHYTETMWWFWAWIFFALFQLFILWLYPVVIAPLFNKYEPIRDETLKNRIVEMAEKAGVRTKGIFQVDAGKRSRHSNAYFTGIGKTKRIVLFDTLIASHSAEEIVSVLAHEIGHWKKKHVLKQLLFMEIISFLAFYLTYRLAAWPLLYETFGFTRNTSYAGILLAVILLKPAAFFLNPVGSLISRKHEKEADDFAFSLIGQTRSLVDALKQLAKDNLSNLYPHPLYVWFYYSHPPLTERIERLIRMKRPDSSP